MKVEKHLTINLGGYQSLRIGVVDCVDFVEADSILIKEITNIERLQGMHLPDSIKKTLRK